MKLPNSFVIIAELEVLNADKRKIDALNEEKRRRQKDLAVLESKHNGTCILVPYAFLKVTHLMIHALF